MKAYWVLSVAILLGCQKSEVISDFTGNEASYGLVQASQYAISGTVTFKERKDGTTTILVKLAGTSGAALLPVHMHLGDLSVDGAPVAFLLKPVNSQTGTSETIITQLADETKVTYKSLLKLSAYINVHLASTGAESNIILAAGNIGTNGTKSSANGRIQIGVCSSK